MLVALLDIERAVASSLGRRFSLIQLATCRWQGQSETAVAVEGVKTEVETLPPEAERRSYFLEVSVAREAFSAQTLCSVSALPRGVPGPGGGSSGARVVRAVRLSRQRDVARKPQAHQRRNGRTRASSEGGPAKHRRRPREVGRRDSPDDPRRVRNPRLRTANGIRLDVAVHRCRDCASWPDCEGSLRDGARTPRGQESRSRRRLLCGCIGGRRTQSVGLAYRRPTHDRGRRTRNQAADHTRLRPRLTALDRLARHGQQPPALRRSNRSENRWGAVVSTVLPPSQDSLDQLTLDGQ